MTPLDVALRVRLERSGFQEGERAVKDFKRAADTLGTSPGSAGLTTGLEKAEKGAKEAKRAVDALGASEERLKSATGLETLQREAARLGTAIGRSEAQARELRATADRLKDSSGGELLAREIRKVEVAGQRATTDLEALRRAAEQMGDVTGAENLKSDIDALAGGSKRARREIDDVRDAAQRLGRQTGIEDLGRGLRQAETEAERLERRIRSVDQATSRMGPARGGGRAHDFGSEFADRSGANYLLPGRMSAGGVAGLAAGAAAYGAGALAVNSTQKAMSMETAMAGVSLAMDNPTPAQLSAIETGISTLSVKTGVAKTEIASLVAEAAKAGTAYEDLLKIADFGQKFGIAAEMTSSEAGNSLSVLRNQFGLTMDGLKQTADVINYVADTTTGTEAGILNFMKRVGPGAKMVNMAPRDVAAFGATFEGVGIAPEVAGTGMNALLGNLGNAPTYSKKDKDFSRALRMLGTNGQQVQQDVLKDASGTIISLLQNLQKLPQAEQLRTLEGLGGREYADDFANLAGQLPQLIDALNKARSEQANGSVEKTFSTFNATSERGMGRAMKAIEDLGSELGKSFVPAVETFADAVEWFAGGAAREIRRQREMPAIVEKQLAGQELTKEEKDRLAADPRMKALTDATVFDRKDQKRQSDRIDQDRDLRMMDDPDEQAAAVARARAKRRQEDLQRQIGEEKTTLGILSPEQPGYQDATRRLEGMQRSLDEIERTLKDMGSGSVDPISFRSMNGGGGRVINASLGGGGGSFAGAYAGNTPIMDGFAGSSGGGGGSAGGVSGGENFMPGGPSGSVETTSNPGGAAGELFDVFRATGNNDAQSLALLGHGKQESELDPKAWNAKEGAGGILQWRGNRLANLKAFAASKGMNWQDRSVQGAFVRHEMDTDPYERQRSKRFREATTIEEASAGLKDYVRFGDDSAGTRLSNARQYAGAFGARGAAPASAGNNGPAGANGIVSYTNGGATRRQPVTEELMEKITRGVSAVYGEGYRAEIYSGGQGRKGSGLARVGSTRHDDGKAADLYVVGPDGKRVTGDALARLGQHWSATKQGGVGMEMRGGGIHLDQHTDRPPSWNYAGQGGRYTAGQRAAMQQGLQGIPPQYANAAALDAAAVAQAAGPLSKPSYDDDGWSPETKASRPVPSWKKLSGAGPRPGAGAGPGRSPSSPGGDRGVTVHQHFAGVDPGVQARRSQREMGKSIRMADARAMHDTSVPTS